MQTRGSVLFWMDTPEDHNMHTKETLFALTRAPDYQDFIFNGAPAQAHYQNRLTMFANRCLDAATLEIYHGLAFMLEAYPQIQSIRPCWTPEIESNQEIHVIFALEISLAGQNGSCQEYRYETYPDGIDDSNKEMFDLMIELGEAIDAVHWESFNYSKLNDINANTYRSVEQVELAMQQDIGEFVRELEQWAMERETQVAIGAPGRRPGL
jgi:hypothetical protein